MNAILNNLTFLWGDQQQQKTYGSNKGTEAHMRNPEWFLREITVGCSSRKKFTSLNAVDWCELNDKYPLKLRPIESHEISSILV